MAIYTHALDDAVPPVCQGGVLTIGNFDGVHLGHQALLKEAANQGRLLAVPSVAITFDPHPSQLLRPGHVQVLLTTIEDRAALLQAYGVNHVLILQTTSELLHLSARDFFERIVCAGLKARALVEGHDFGFGRGREGTVVTLEQLCANSGLRLKVMRPQEVLAQPVSSSRVRKELLAGDVGRVGQLLGRPYRISGIVETGQKRGSTIGFPTANLEHVRTLVPANGVYAARAVTGGRSWPAAANVGPNPTFGEDVRKIEVHLLDFTGDLYGQALAVDFVARIRDTRPFRDSKALTAQIQEDIASVRRLLSA